MTAAEADRIYSLRARGLNAAAIAERLGLDVATVQGVLNPAIPRSEADPVTETRRVLDDLRHAAAALSRAWDGMHSRDSPQEAIGSPQSGFRTAARGSSHQHTKTCHKPFFRLEIDHTGTERRNIT